MSTPLVRRGSGRRSSKGHGGGCCMIGDRIATVATDVFKHQTLASKWGAGRSCLIRRGLLRRGRGEVARDRIATADPSHVSTAVDRGNVWQGTGVATTSRPHAPTRSGVEASDKDRQASVQTWSEAGSAMQGRAPCLCPKKASRRSRLSRTEGNMGTRGGMPSMLDLHRPPDQAPQLLTLDIGTISLVVARRSRRDGACAENTLQRMIGTIFAANNPMDDCEKLEGGSQRFPPSRSGLGSSTSHYIHTLRWWGASAVAAQPRIAAVGGAASHDRKGATAVVRVRVPCAKDALGYRPWDIRSPSKKLSFGLVAVLEGSFLATSRTRPCLDACTRRLNPHPPLQGCRPTEDPMPF